MEAVKRLGKITYKVYVGVGIAAMGGLFACVLFSVVARYFFSLSWKQLEEFITTLFAFTTFWGLGICVLEKEHVVIDILFRSLRPGVQRFVSLLNHLIALAVTVVACVYSFRYVGQVGNQLSPGMNIPMRYMYGIMPVCFILCGLCLLIRIVSLIFFPEEVPKDPAEKRP